ncbi:MAG: hypothetical protein M1410_04235 [Candidatus Thermoplasmatota archaeon]|jgi:glycogen debranching enzyme|nr:hypothetical protein [Candidatus Thermoplasmatota archaeon]
MNVEKILRESRTLTEKDNLRVYHAWIRERSSAVFRNDTMTLIKGLRGHSILGMDGNSALVSNSRVRTGIWGVKTRHVSHLKVTSTLGESGTSFVKMVRGFGYIFRQFGDFSRIDFVPWDQDAVVMVFTPDIPTHISIEMDIDHLNAWPDSNIPEGYSSMPGDRTMEITSSVGRTIISVEGVTPRFENRENHLRVDFPLEDTVTLAISREGPEFTDSVLEGTLEYHHSVERYCKLVTPSFEFNKAFLWAKHDLLELFTDAGGEYGWYAGLPQFSWFFGRDGEWISMAASECGLEELSEKHLSLLWNFSRHGRIPHEIPADTRIPDTDQIASNGLTSRYMSIDSSPLWIISHLKNVKWHGTRPRKREIDQVVDFLRRCDTDRDGLVENSFRDGLIGWPESWADRRDGACIDVNALWTKALLETDDLQGRNDHSSLLNRFLQKFFIHDGGGLTVYDSVEKGARRCVRSPMELIPAIYFRNADMKFLVRDMSGEDMQTPWGTRSMSRLDAMYDGSYHRGTVWPLMTGWYVLAAYANSLPGEAFASLSTFPRLAFGSRDPGRINETYNDVTGEETGQFAQGWSSAIFVQCVIEGLFGINPDGKDRLQGIAGNFNPVLPSGWSSMSVENLKYRSRIYEVSVTANGKGVKART